MTNEALNTAREVVGTVVSDAMQKTIVVKLERKVKHLKYGKYIKKSTKVHAHDENKTAKLGDKVKITETKPYSKTKTWNLVEVL